MNFKIQFPFYLLIFLLISCSGDDINIPQVDLPGPEDWLIPFEEVIDPGIGKDGIPSVDEPQFSTPEEINPVFDNELVIGFEHQGDIKAYPIPILNWHEVVNDKIKDLDIAITYCPLTATAMGWNRKIGSITTTFGVSGLLYNTNLMPYDRQTNSTWSQLEMQCVNGLLKGDVPQVFTTFETRFSTWKKAFPDSEVMNGFTGFDRQYSEYPYLDYRTNNEFLLYPIDTVDLRLPQKEKVLGVFSNDKVKTYQFNESGAGTDIIHDEIEGMSIIVLRSTDDHFNIAFLNPDNLVFQPEQDAFPTVMTDDFGNAYDLIGRIISGPNEGEKLELPLSFLGYWFTWSTFYDNVEIYEE